MQSRYFPQFKGVADVRAMALLMPSCGLHVCQCVSWVACTCKRLVLQAWHAYGTTVATWKFHIVAGTVCSPPAETGLRQRLLNSGDAGEQDLEAVAATPPAVFTSPNPPLEFDCMQKFPAESPVASAASGTSQHTLASHLHGEEALAEQPLQVVEVNPSHSSLDTSLEAAKSLDAVPDSMEPSRTQPCEALGLLTHIGSCGSPAREMNNQDLR